MGDFFTAELAERYDERNRRLAPISDALHFLIRLVLRDLPVKSRVLCAGVGTGAEILSLSQAFPEWTFVALDPSESMLQVCRQRLTEAGLASRCDFVHGFAHELPARPDFDVVLTILVAHFVKRDERLDFYQSLTRRLRDGGYLVNAEISFDLDSPEFPTIFRGWEAVQSLMGATPESLAALPRLLRETLCVLPPTETESLLRQSGIPLPVRFYQALMIHGWYGKK